MYGLPAFTVNMIIQKKEAAFKRKHPVPSFDKDDIFTTMIGFANQTDKVPEIARSLLETFGSLRNVLEGAAAERPRRRTENGMNRLRFYALRKTFISLTQNSSSLSHW